MTICHEQLPPRTPININCLYICGRVVEKHRQTARKERTCLLILGMSGVNRFIGVYRVISGRER